MPSIRPCNCRSNSSVSATWSHIRYIMVIIVVNGLVILLKFMLKAFDRPFRWMTLPVKGIPSRETSSNFRCLLLKPLPHSSAFSWGESHVENASSWTNPSVAAVLMFGTWSHKVACRTSSWYYEWKWPLLWVFGCIIIIIVVSVSLLCVVRGCVWIWLPVTAVISLSFQ